MILTIISREDETPGLRGLSGQMPALTTGRTSLPDRGANETSEEDFVPGPRACLSQARKSEEVKLVDEPGCRTPKPKSLSLCPLRTSDFPWSAAY